jgi:3-phosphoshikimate 1-carboxyvinyltransferase
MLGSVAAGETRVRGLLRSEDVLATLSAFRTLGVAVEDREDGVVIAGRGPEALSGASVTIDLGNSGTSMRLLAGLFAGLPVEVTLIGDASLSRRPMKRVIEPLRLMGAEIAGSALGTAPLRIAGRPLRAIDYRLPVASAQVKSAVLLAGLSASGTTRVAEPGPSRDHTERMLPGFGVNLDREGEWIALAGGQRLRGAGLIEVPGDLSSAAFFVVAALIVPDSDLTIEGVGLNPTRTGILEILRRMGGNIEARNERRVGSEPVGDLRVRSSRLQGIEIGGDLIVRAIDEVPALCVAAARAEGRTVIREAAELRVKESDRLAGMARILTGMGARARELPDGIEIEGRAALRGAEVDTHFDHRLAMAAAVAGLAAEGETTVREAECIATSFPGFAARLTEVAG